jgi:hypothetical protein
MRSKTLQESDISSEIAPTVPVTDTLRGSEFLIRNNFKQASLREERWRKPSYFWNGENSRKEKPGRVPAIW